MASAGTTKAVSGAVTTYTITSNNGNTITVGVTSGVTGNSLSTLSISGVIDESGMNILSSLLLQIATNQLP